MAQEDGPGVPELSKTQKASVQMSLGCVTARLFLCRNLIKIIGPPLHHFPAFRQVFSMVIDTPYLIALHVGKLTLDRITIKQAALIKNRGCRVSKAMACSTVVIAHSVKGIQHRIFAHVLDRFMHVRKHIFPLPIETLQFPERRNRLPGERYNMVVPHFHAFSRDTPLGLIQVNFIPCGSAQFIRAYKGEQE